MDLTSTHHPHSPRPFTDWALNVALALDQAHPGFLRFAFGGTKLARQARFAAFAAIDPQHPETLKALAERLRRVAPPGIVPGTTDPLGQIAQHLSALRPRRILEAVFGSCPKGLVGLFARLGDAPLSPDPGLYRLVWSLYADPQHRERMKLLMEKPGIITTSHITIVSRLDDLLLRRAVLDRLWTPREVASFEEAVRLIKKLVPGASEDRLAQSLDALGPLTGSHWSGTKSLAAWTLRWLEEMEHAPVPGPIEPDDPEFRLLVGKALLEAGRKYKNCLADQFGHVAAGRRLYYEWLREPGAIVELHCLSDGCGRPYFSVGQVRGVSNARLRLEFLKAIRARLSQSGLLFAGAVTGQRAPLNGLLNIFEDEDANGTYVSFLDDAEEPPELSSTRAA